MNLPSSLKMPHNTVEDTEIANVLYYLPQALIPTKLSSENSCTVTLALRKEECSGKGGLGAGGYTAPNEQCLAQWTIVFQVYSFVSTKQHSPEHKSLQCGDS